jgi:hypothetical protein
VDNPAQGNQYPVDSEQIQWVQDYHTPYDFCYDEWLVNGVTWPDGTKKTLDQAGQEYKRPSDMTQEEKDY